MSREIAVVKVVNFARRLRNMYYLNASGCRAFMLLPRSPKKMCCLTREIPGRPTRYPYPKRVRIS